MINKVKYILFQIKVQAYSTIHYDRLFGWFPDASMVLHLCVKIHSFW